MFKIKCAGIYKITNTITEEYYIGMSVDIFTRWQSHYSNVKLKKHSSPKLLKSIHTYGIQNHIFSILEYHSITQFKLEHKVKGKDLTNLFNRFLLDREKEIMKSHSIDFSLNKSNRYFS